MQLTATQLQQAMGCSQTVAAIWAGPLSKAVSLHEIDTPLRLAALIATIGHESTNLSALSENLNYSAQRLREVCSEANPGTRWRALLPRAGQLARNPMALANAVYGGRMGNGAEATGDGWRYRGRGPIGITGKANMAAVTELVQQRTKAAPDFVLHPEMLETPEWGSMSACALWTDWDLNDLADKGSFLSISRKVNIGTASTSVTPNGWPDRRARYTRALKVLEV